MDLSSMSTKKKSEEGIWVDILDISGDPIIDEKTKEPVQFKIAGSNSKLFKAKQKELVDANQRKKNGLSAADKIEFSKKIYVACVLDWKHVIWKGEKLDCTEANVRMIFDESEIIFQQIVEKVDDKAAFLES